VDTFIVGVSPYEVKSGLINDITDALREPSNLHIVGRDEGEDRCS
jgi:hypothetical protein